MKRFADRLAASGAPAPTDRSTKRSKPHMREPHIWPVHRQNCRQSGTNQQAGLFKGADPLEGISTLFGTIDLRLLVPFLQRESASVAALALALAPRDISVQLLRQLGTESGARILHALAQTETATPAALDALREALEELREESLSHIRLGRGLVGSERVAELLSGLDVGTRNAILAKLENGDRPEGTHAGAARSLATAVRKKLVTSLQLATLATKDLALVLAQLSDKEIALALLLEPDSVKEKILCGLSSKRRAEVCEELELLGKRRGSIRKLDVEAAAEKLVAAAQELRDTGRIVFPWEEALV
jgi:flagellar motor switch protein FliG